MHLWVNSSSILLIAARLVPLCQNSSYRCAHRHPNRNPYSDIFQSRSNSCADTNT
jgi:hypothetical protein